MKKLQSVLAVLLAVFMVFQTTGLGTSFVLADEDGEISPMSLEDPQETVHTYEFKVDDEINSDWTQIVKDGDELLQPETPAAPTGKVFAGWYDENEILFSSFGEQNEVTEGKTTLHAFFTDAVYNVYFVDNTGNVSSTLTLADGAEADLSVAANKINLGQNEGITGWYTDAAYTEKIDTVVVNGQDITVYAKVEKGFWVIFDSNGGSYIEPAFFTSKATAPVDPTMSGYQFDGWYYEAVGDEEPAKVDFASVTASTTVYAAWTPVNAQYTVIYWLENANDDNYSYQESVIKTGLSGSPAIATDKTYVGFTFDHVDEAKVIDGDGTTIVNAYFKRNIYTVYFGYGTKNAAYSERTLTCTKIEHKHTDSEKVLNCKRVHYHKTSCYTYTCGLSEHTHNDRCYQTVTYNIKIDAKYGAFIGKKWPGGNYKVYGTDGTYQAYLETMPLGGQKYSDKSSSSGSSTAYYYVQDITGTNYILHHSDTISGTGWTVSKEDREEYPITGFTFKLTGSTAIGSTYNGAKFYYTRNQYKVILVNEGVTEEKVFYYEADISDALPEKAEKHAGIDENLVFVGWFSNEEGTGDPVSFDDQTMPAKNITVYAKWAEPIPEATVYYTLVANNDASETIVGTYGSKIDSAALAEAETKVVVPEGMTFVGWCTRADDGSEKLFNPDTKLYGDVKLFPMFKANTATYVVEYVEDGSETPASDFRKYAAGSGAKVQTPVVSSYVNEDGVEVFFLKWQNVDTDAECYPGDVISISKDVTLKAVYGPKPIKTQLVYNYNFGENPSTYTNDDLVNNSNVTVVGLDNDDFSWNAPEGHEFKGWAKNSASSTATYEEGDLVRVSTGGANTLYAVWQTLSYKVTYKVDGKVVSDPAETKYEYGAAVTIADKYVKAGYIVTDWTINGEKAENFTMPAHDVVIEATTSLSYHVIYVDDSDQLMTKYDTNLKDDTDYAANSTAIAITPSGSVHDNSGKHELVGWMTVKPTGQYAKYNEINKASDLATLKTLSVWRAFGSDVAIANQDVTLWAVWANSDIAKTFTVTYDANGGAFAEDTQNVFENIGYGEDTPSTNSDPTRVGYTFINWKDADGTTPADVVTADATYYAQWSANDNTKYTVEYYYQKNGQYPEEATRSASRNGETATTVSVTDADKVPTGNYVLDTAAGNVFTGTIAGDGSLVLKVYFKEQFTVTYKPGDHGTFEVKTTEKLDYNTNTPAAPKTTGDAGYSFTGWDKAIADVVTENATYVAQWSANDNTKYTVEIYYQAKGKYPEKATSTEERQGTTDTSVSVTDADKTPSGNYVLDSAAANVLTGKVAGDGSLVLKVYFKEQFTVTYEPGDHGTFEVKTTEDIDYGTTTPAAPETTGDAGYSFTGWTPAVAGTVTADATYVAQWTANTNTKYTVEHYLQDLNKETYTLDATENLTGTTGEDTKAAAKSYEGFTAQSFAQAKIAGDGSTVIKIYYTRNAYALIYKIVGDFFTDDNYARYENILCGTSLNLLDDDMTEAGYTFSGWTGLPATMPGKDVVVTGSYTANTNTAYTVNHYKQLLDGSYAETPDDVDHLTGTTGAQTMAEAKTYAGFTVQEFEQATIAGDGSTVVDIYYTRNEDTAYTVEHYLQNTDGETYPEEPEDIDEMTGITGDTTAAEAKEYTGFTVVEPIEQLEIAGDGTTVVKIFYTRDADTSYTVNHYLQNLDGTYPEEPELTETLVGMTGTETEAAAKEDEFPGFKAVEFEQAEIAGDGSTVIDIYYERQAYTVTYILDGEQYGEVETYLVGEIVEYRANPEKEGYTFSGWTRARATSFEMPAEDVVLEGVLTKNVHVVIVVVDDEVVDEIEVPYGDPVPTPDTPTEEGYHFGGWSEIPETMPDHDITVSGIMIKDLKPQMPEQDVEGAVTDPTPVKPNNNTGKPDTGDTAQPILWIVLMAASMVGVVGTRVYGKKRRDEE